MFLCLPAYSKTIEEFKQKSIDLKQIKLKKEKDVELTRQKISMLREQLNAAEKILNVNEKSLDIVKTHEKNIDTKLTKLQNMKKVQQELLQKILSSPSIVEAHHSTMLNSQQHRVKEDPNIKVPAAEHPPQSKEKFNLSQLKSILADKLSKELLEANMKMNLIKKQSEAAANAAASNAVTSADIMDDSDQAWVMQTINSKLLIHLH